MPKLSSVEKTRAVPQDAPAKTIPAANRAAHAARLSAPAPPPMPAVESISLSIVSLRGQRVILDADLDSLYGVEIRRLNEQIKRNLDRFPADLLFRPTAEEFDSLGRERQAGGQGCQQGVDSLVIASCRFPPPVPAVFSRSTRPQTPSRFRSAPALAPLQTEHTRIHRACEKSRCHFQLQYLGRAFPR